MTEKAPRVYWLQVFGIMTKQQWKRNDALMKKALKLMNISFTRNTKSWETVLKFGRSLKSEITCVTIDDNNEDCPSTPEDLGAIKYFNIETHAGNYGQIKTIDNMFYGVQNFAELAIKIDLLAI